MRNYKYLRLALFAVFCALIVPWTVWALDVLIPKVAPESGWTYVKWEGTSTATGTASAITGVPIYGQLMYSYYEPIEQNNTFVLPALSNTARLASKAAWNFNNTPTEYDSTPADWYCSFGGETALPIPNTGGVFSTSPQMYDVTNAYSGIGAGARFRMLMVYSPVLTNTGNIFSAP
jgi:hypothetical protein